MDTKIHQRCDGMLKIHQGLGLRLKEFQILGVDKVERVGVLHEK